MNFNDYQLETRRTAPLNQDTLGSLVNFSMGLAGESGEVVDQVKKAAFQGHDLQYAQLANELGDVLWYLSRAADAIGYKLLDIALLNLDKLHKRYPNGFSEEDSVKRVDAE